MGAGFRTGESRTVVWAAAEESNVIELRPGATYSLDLPAEFAGATIQPQCQSELNGAWKDVVDPDGVFPFAVVADKINVVPSALYLSGLGLVRFVSNEEETCTAKLIMSR